MADRPDSQTGFAPKRRLLFTQKMPKDSWKQVLHKRLRQAPPAGIRVLPGSTPVLYFGAPAERGVATLSLNPSSLEFRNKNKVWLTDDEQRFLRMPTVWGEPELAAAIRSCDEYFRRSPNRGWFNWLENGALSAVGSSFADGTACHLDIVQWATDPAWGELTPAEQESLVQGDGWFLRDVLERFRFRLLLINGKTACEAFLARVGAAGLETELADAEKLGSLTVRKGRLPSLELQFRAWSKPLDKAIPAADRAALGQWLST